MAHQIFVALTTEGTTDVRFLENIVQQAFEYVASECSRDIDIISYTLETTKVGKDSFADYVVAAAREGLTAGATTIAVHSDSDRNTYDERKAYNFVPVQEAVNALSDDEACKLITPIIPVRMIEAWMLADKPLLKIEIGTTLSDHDLGIDGNPEQMADPKERITVAIRTANDRATHKSPVRNVDISDLYEILGQSLEPEKLMSLESYQRFLDEIRATYREIGVMY